MLKMSSNLKAERKLQRFLVDPLKQKPGKQKNIYKAELVVKLNLLLRSTKSVQFP